MKLIDFLKVVEAHESGQVDHNASCVDVWTALSAAEPGLANEALQLFSTVDAAAAWCVRPMRSSGASPARLIAEGRVGEVMALIRKTSHGFVA